VKGVRKNNVRRIWNRLVRDSEGQALTEFVIVLPVICMMFLFSLWFFELVVVKIKTQEAARYAAFEATSYPLHDYKQGGTALGSLAGTMSQEISAEATLRYADLDSSTTVPLGSGMMALSWAPPLGMAPVVSVWDSSEPTIYDGGGATGPLIQFGFKAAGWLVDLISGLAYTNSNKYAQQLIAVGNNMGGARQSRMFGASSWGFNKSGYVQSMAIVTVGNAWCNAGIQGMLIPADACTQTISEKYALLADSWRLHDGADVDNSKTNSGYYKQVERMYFLGGTTQNTAKTIFGEVTGDLLLVGKDVATNAPLGAILLAPYIKDFFKPTLVSKSYGSSATSGQISVSEDDGDAKYDTSPAGSTNGGGDLIKAYKDTRDARGEHFMGCKEPMKLGCTDSLSQDNPFGDYIVRN
jgi:hypothetical protein